MVAVGFGVIWFGYAVGIYGYCLVKGYAVGFSDLFHLSGGWPNPKQKSTNSTSSGSKTTTPAAPTGTLGKGVA